MNPDDYQFELEDSLGKKRKHTAWMTSGQDKTLGSLFQCYYNMSSDGKVSLHITNQPERQHRARYQTEGSRGAVKDRSQSGFPVVELRGYDNPDKPAVCQVFIGNDIGNPIPHIHYQACRVTGKNLTPCQEMKKEGTDVILIDFEPEKDNIIVCDCVGILKERHSDIEGKMTKQKLRTNWKKKSTKCRMVFRTEIELSNGKTEILQVVSDLISCTQLPGTPEILKMSLTSCDPAGGEELWMIGKNFMKDSVVVFQDSDRTWVRSVHPNKEFFNATHLIVTVPQYFDLRITQPMKVYVMVTCVGKTSEPQVVAFLPTSSSGSSSEIISENRFQNIFPPAMTTPAAISTRPTILEPIEGQKQPQQQQQQHHLHQQTMEIPEGSDKKSSLDSNLDEDSSTFDFPIMRNRASSDLRSRELSQKLSEYRIVDDNSLPTNVPNVPIQEGQGISPTFQQRLNFTGMINPPGYSHPAESSIGVYGSENPLYSMPVASQPFPASGPSEIPASEKCNITFGKPGTENATISIKLPPSVLENQAQLGTIVNTINKALTLTRDPNTGPAMSNQEWSQNEDKSQLVVTSNTTSQTSEETIRTSDWSGVTESEPETASKQRRVSNETIPSSHLAKFVNPCNMLTQLFNPEAVTTVDHVIDDAALQQQQQSFIDQPGFGVNRTEAAKKQKVSTNMSGETLVWDSSNEKPVTCNEASAILALNNAWNAESVTVTANALMAQLHESSFAHKVAAQQQQQQEQQDHQQQPQGMWHFPIKTDTDLDQNPHRTLVSNLSTTTEENSKWETIDAKPMTEELHPTQALPEHPQTSIISSADWSSFLATSEKGNKWMNTEEKVVSTEWTATQSTSVLMPSMMPNVIGPEVITCHGNSPEMIPVNPKDLVMNPSPMEVDSFVYRTNQVS